ncbi:MAG: polyphosphate polymerase domain-containing protein [Lachnospiraceae bacterium]|nr:polyphosphate polymerase domain-containing protein [Lachnospiraceae bacterium]
MEQLGTYRHELKYQINYAEYLAMRQRISAFMKLDENSSKKGNYLIRSIYFDNVDDKVLREKLDGVQKREKFRIRYYNDDFSFITLEKKMKHNSLCLKLSATITEEECRALLAGKTEWMPMHNSEVVRELYYKMNSQQLRPRVMVSYVREPFVYEAGNVRVTFDSCIRTSLYHREFLEEKTYDISAQNNNGEIILEVKYDEFIPEVIVDLLQIEGIRQQAFSKYGVCRRFG